jgi:hypothetical protein
VTMSTAALLQRAETEEDPDARPRRRSFSPEYKLGILAEYEALTDAGAKGALRRREPVLLPHRGVPDPPLDRELLRRTTDRFSAHSPASSART